MKFKKIGKLAWLAAVTLLISSTARPVYGYSVLAHEAIVDRAWEDSIEPLLLQRFPGTTLDQLIEAHAYAYGGCIIQDMGYYPFSGRYFSDLTHYVRSGDFVESLIRNASDVDDYAFALGALSHYAADITGHQMAVNRSVPLLYPRLFARYGEDVTYEDDPAAHIKTEFAFDVIQVAAGKYAPNRYHHFIGFRVSKALVERAFLETYGIELKTIFTSLDLALGTYRTSISSVVPEMTRVAWAMKENQFQNTISRFNYEQEWGHRYKTPGFFAKTPAFLFQVVPKAGPFRALAFRQPPPQAEKLFLESLDVSLDCYRQLLRQLADGRLRLENINFDTGMPARLGDYRLADQAYARLLNDLAKTGFRNVSPPLKDNIIGFYDQGDPPAAGARARSGSKTHRELDRLRNCQAEAARNH